MGKKKRSDSIPLLDTTASTPQVELEGVVADASTPQIDLAEASTRQVELGGVVADTSISSPQAELDGGVDGGVVEASRSTPQVELEQIIIEDGILCSIISSLPVREAVRTCVLSTRWRNIWIHRPKLRFDTSMLDSHTCHRLQDKSLSQEEKYELLMRKREQFIQSVDSVLQQHRGNNLVGLYVHYYLTKVHSHHLDKWVGFAVASKAKRLALQLPKPYFNSVEEELYNFPCQLLGSSCTLEQLTLNFCYLKPPCKFDGLSRLRNLNLYYLDISGEDINRLLYNCYTLESLNIWFIRQLVALCIPQSLNQLNFLFIKQCPQLREINISAVNLGKMTYIGPQVDFVFRESSHLQDATIIFGPVDDPSLDYHLNRLSSSLPHLRSLVIHPIGVSKMSNLPNVSNSFINLTHLDWVWSASIKMSRQCLATILDSAPFLEEFKLRFWVHLPVLNYSEKRVRSRVVEQPPRRLKKLRRMLPEHPRTHLKKVEIHDFYWDKWQVEIALYLLKNAKKLESITLLKGRICHPEVSETDIKNLSHQVPSNVKLVIL